MADKNVNIILSATDATHQAFQSVTANLSNLAKTAAGTALGIAGFNGISALFSGITANVFGMNQSLDATRRSGISMLDSIRSGATGTEAAFAGSAKQVENWGRQLREIREREQTGLDTYADQTKRLNDELADLMAGKNIQTLARDQHEVLSDLAQSHADKLSGIQDRINEEKAKGIYVDGILYAQGNKKKLDALQDELDKENTHYNEQVARRKRDNDQALAALKESNDKRIAEVQRSLDQQREAETRFTRDIKEAYADLAAAKNLAVSAGGSGGGLAAGTGAVITYREELQKLKTSSKDVFDQFNVFFKEEGIRSPFNIADIQRAGTQLIQFSGGSLKNMQQIVQMAESLASSPAVADYSGPQKMDLAIRALSEAYNGQFTSLQRIFNISGTAFESLHKGTFTTTEFTNKLNNSLEQTGINYKLVDQYAHTLDGSWGNLVETGRLLATTIMDPAYHWLTERLIEINTWVSANQTTINAWANTLRDRVANFFKNDVQPALDRFIAWFQSPQAKKDMDSWIGNLRTFGDAAMAVAGAIKGIADNWGKINSGASGFINGMNTLVQGGAREARGAFGLDFISSLFGKRALGGPVTGGVPYLVGEHGPELVIPSQSGTVIPHDTTMGMLNKGGASVHIENFHSYNQADINAFAERLSWRLT